jgi:hypothetical protein
MATKKCLYFAEKIIFFQQIVFYYLKDLSITLDLYIMRKRASQMRIDYGSRGWFS